MAITTLDMDSNRGYMGVFSGYIMNDTVNGTSQTKNPYDNFYVPVQNSIPFI